MTTTETVPYVSPRVRQMRKFYGDHPEVTERGEPTRQGKVVEVDDGGLLRVQWAKRVGIHTEDEIEAVHRRPARGGPQLRGMVDAFADVRGFLPTFADDDGDAFDHND